MSKIMNLLKHTVITALPVVVGVILAGIVLDTAATTNVAIIQSIAAKAKRGLNS